MNAVRKYTKVSDTRSLVLEGLPFNKGEYVEVLILPINNDKFNTREEWKSLFKEIQEMETSKNISEEDIAEEIKKYRIGL